MAVARKGAGAGEVAPPALGVWSARQQEHARQQLRARRRRQQRAGGERGQQRLAEVAHVIGHAEQRVARVPHEQEDLG